MTAFGTASNPASTDEGQAIFSGSLQQNHAVPKEVFSGSNSKYARAREFLGFIDFDGENADRNGHWVPGNERDALALGSGMHRGSHPRYSQFVAGITVTVHLNIHSARRFQK
jgi:A nuclease family of the HNH/ENDO VII superfamily with conserved AHH